MLDICFVVKASSLKPRPSLLYLETQMCGRNVSWVDKKNALLHEPKAHKEVGACRRVKRASSSLCGLKGMNHMI